MDVRVGGTWRWISHGPDGQDAPFKGEYLEVVPPERLVQTEIFDVPGFDDRAAINTLTLEAVDSQTKLVARSRFPSIETYDRLAEEIAKG